MLFMLAVGVTAQADDHLLFITDVQPSPGSTISTDQPEISFVAYLKSDLRQQSSIRVEIMGCGTFTVSPTEHPLVEMPISPDLVADSGVTEAWSFTADLAAAGCTLDFPAGFEVVVTIIAYSTTIFPPFSLFTASNTVSWTFTIDDPSASPIDFDPPTPLLIESISPSIANEGSTVTIMGSGFIEPSQLNRSQGSRAYLMLEDGPTSASTSVKSSTELTFTVPDDITCGQHLVQIRNDGAFLPFANNLIQQSVPIGFEVRCPSEILNPIPPVEDPPPSGDTPEYEIVDLDLPSSAEVGEPINGSVEISNRSFEDGDDEELQIYINNQLEATQSVSVEASSAETYPLNFSFSETGNFLIRVELVDDEIATTISVTGQAGSNNQNPPPSDSGDLAELDANGNCSLDDSEFFVAADGWIAGTMSDVNFFAAVDAWIGQSDICTSTAAVNRSNESTSRAVAIALNWGWNGLQISALGNTERLRVEIYNTHGRRIDSLDASSNGLFWNLQDSRGRQLANGVYLCQVNAYDLSGNVISREIFKVVVVR